MNIIDVNIDCLQRIFDRLDFVSLFNVAVANGWLRRAARVVYQRRFGNKMIFFNITENESGIIEYGISIVITGLRKCLQYLRCFGTLIQMLGLYYFDMNSESCECIDYCLNQYCADTLSVIAFKNKPAHSMQHMLKPFVNVSKVMVLGGDFGNCFPFFSQWFPNVNALYLDTVCMDNHHIDTPFEHLLNLEIDINNGIHRHGFNKTEATNLLRMCQQLLVLKIHMSGRQGMTITTLLNIIRANPPIARLNVTMDKYSTTVKPSEIQRLTHEHPNLIEINMKNYKFPADAAVELIQQLNFLEVLEFQIDDPMDVDRIFSQLDQQWQLVVQRDDLHRYIVTASRNN